MTQLRPIEIADVSFLEQQLFSAEAAGEFNWFGPQPEYPLRERVEGNETITETRGALAVVTDDGSLIGDVSWHRVDHAMPPHGRCWNMGVWLHPDARGKGHGTLAQRALVEYLFTISTFERIEAGTEADNIAEQRALEKAGFRRDGVLRSASFRAGEYRDMVVYSILRDEL